MAPPVFVVLDQKDAIPGQMVDSVDSKYALKDSDSLQLLEGYNFDELSECTIIHQSRTDAEIMFSGPLSYKNKTNPFPLDDETVAEMKRDSKLRYYIVTDQSWPPPEILAGNEIPASASAQSVVDIFDLEYMKEQKTPETEAQIIKRKMERFVRRELADKNDDVDLVASALAKYLGKSQKHTTNAWKDCKNIVEEVAAKIQKRKERDEE